MSKQCFDVAVTKTIRVELDTAKLDAEFWNEFNTIITDRGGPDNEYLAEHIGWNFVQGDEKFVEGVGLLSEMNITAREIESEVAANETDPS